VDVGELESEQPRAGGQIATIASGKAITRRATTRATPPRCGRASAGSRTYSRFWTERELGALLHKETLIPVLHQLTFENVAEYSGILPDLAGFETARDPVNVIAQKIAAAVVPHTS
jgi:hypothetical protein